MKLLRLVLLSAAIALASMSAQASTSTSTMPVKVVIQKACDVTATPPTTLDFGTQGPLIANVDQTSTITVVCTPTTAYNIGLDGGASASTSARTMVLGSNTVGYQLYSDSARSTVWGNVVGTDTVSGSGSGVNQPYTVYGRIPPQATPVAGTYSDTIGVTVTY